MIQRGELYFDFSDSENGAEAQRGAGAHRDICDKQKMLQRRAGAKQQNCPSRIGLRWGSKISDEMADTPGLLVQADVRDYGHVKQFALLSMDVILLMLDPESLVSLFTPSI